MTGETILRPFDERNNLFCAPGDAHCFDLVKSAINDRTHVVPPSFEYDSSYWCESDLMSDPMERPILRIAGRGAMADQHHISPIHDASVKRSKRCIHHETSSPPPIEAFDRFHRINRSCHGVVADTMVAVETQL